jgi:uncharacterized protein (DUF1800 family)
MLPAAERRMPTELTEPASPTAGFASTRLRIAYAPGLTARATTLLARLAAVVAIAVLAGCGGGGGGSGSAPSTPATPTATPPTRAEAARFLRQATFGPTAADIDRVVARGYAGWIDDQLAVPPSTQVAYLKALPQKATQDDRVEAWIRNAVLGPDQLRQRMSFALSQIFVVSERSPLGGEPIALAAYYDVLQQGAFGRYRDLLGNVTLSPAMGVYLSMLGNQKPDAARNIRPDENYAREVMQLFTIGLVQLNADGTPKTDAQGVGLPTYDQSVIEGYANVFTGWTFGGSPTFFQPSFDYERPMQAFAAMHSTGAKKLVNGATVPAGQTAEQDLAQALDSLANHPNVGPFIGRQLIQRLVTSNPSPAYVQRVAKVFDDDGRGVRGNLGAVVRAILLDDEARGTPTETSGKLVEPLFYLTALWRAYDGRAANGRFLVPGVDFALGQGPLRSPSVFNFYRPDYAPPGEMRTRGLAAPELGITNEYTTATTANVVAFTAFGALDANAPPTTIRLDLARDAGAAGDANALVGAVADRLLGGAISPELRASVVSMVERHPASAAQVRVAEAIHGIAVSPEYAVLR